MELLCGTCGWSYDGWVQIQRDPGPVLERWQQRLAEREDERSAARVYANNHFAGFGPSTVNAFLRAADREPRTWSTTEEGQASLGDFGEP